MRSSLRKLRGMGLQRSELRERKEHQPRAKLDELVQAVQAPLMAELLDSGRSSDKLLQIYSPFVAFSVLAILKGLFSGPLHTATKASHAPSARKKRA